MKAVVDVLVRPLRRVRDMVEVETLILGHVPDLDPLQGGVPARRVVRAALPGVVDGHEPGLFRVPVSSQVAVPGKELRIDLPEKLSRFGGTLAFASARTRRDGCADDHVFGEVV